MEWRWGLGWPWRGVELVTPFRVGIGWRGVRQILELERVEWRGVASDTGEELERNCANPKQFSERERGVALDTGEELERNCANPEQSSERCGIGFTVFKPEKRIQCTIHTFFKKKIFRVFFFTFFTYYA